MLPFQPFFNILLYILMSYSSQLIVPSSGDLGKQVIAPDLPAVTLVSGVGAVISNTIYLEEGIWILTKQVFLSTNADGTTEIDNFTTITTNEIGFIQTSCVISNPNGVGAYAPQTNAFTITGTAIVQGTTTNEFVVSATWTGAGSSPTSFCRLSAIKVV